MNDRLPDQAQEDAVRLRELADEAVALQSSDAENAGTRFTELRDSLVMSALYEIPRVLARLSALEGERDNDFENVVRWLQFERDYQIKKFDDYGKEIKPVEYYIQQFDSYIQRLPLFGLDSPLGFQAALKLAATAVALCEHIGAEHKEWPMPGVESGNIQLGIF